MSQGKSNLFVTIKGGGEVGSVVAITLFRHGYRPIIVESRKHAALRDGTFVTAILLGEAEIEGVRAERCNSLETLKAGVARKMIVPVFLGKLTEVLVTFAPAVVIDARMQRRRILEIQTAQAPLVIGLGPGFVAGESVHVVIETKPGPNIGRVITQGSAERIIKKPISLSQYKYERFIYAPVSGTFCSALKNGMVVDAGDLLGNIEGYELRSHVAGVIRSIPNDGVVVKQGAKMVAIDPHGHEESASDRAEHLRKIAAGVLDAIQRFR